MAELLMEKQEGASSIEITSQMIQNIQRINFKGKLVYGNQQLAKETVHKLAAEQTGYILDMQNLEFIDSTGFGVLINLAKRLRRRNHQMVILVSNPAIRQLFRIAKFHLIFPILETQEEALKLLKEGHQPTLPIDQY